MYLEFRAQKRDNWSRLSFLTCYSFLNSFEDYSQLAKPDVLMLSWCSNVNILLGRHM